MIYKFLMRSSSVDDFIVVVKDNLNYPLIVFRQGKGASVARPYKSPYVYIIDVAFIGDTLYAITQAEDLIPLDIALDGDAKPLVTIGMRVIRRPPDYFDYDLWNTSDDDDDDSSSEEEEEGVEDDDDGEEEENGKIADDDDNIEEDEVAGGDDNIEDVAHDNDEPQDDGSHHASFSDDYTRDEENDESIIVSRHLIVSGGKLLIGRRHQQIPSNNAPTFTRRVDVLEADTITGTPSVPN